MFGRVIARARTAMRHIDRIAEISDQQKGLAQRLDHLSWQVDLLTRENRLIAASQSLPPEDLWKPFKPLPAKPSDNAFPNSTLCRQESFETPFFPYWTGKIGHAPTYHRKLWEFVFICQSLWERGALKSGAKGLGFGVGEEPLSAFFASQGCQILATDLAADTAVGTGWIETAQHAAAKESLRMPGICPDDVFDRNVEFRACDMNAIPSDFTDFDFCWSACALEHLGSIDLGLTFIERSVDALAPGGWAVHTTELNMSSNTHTVAEGGTVLFRKCDFEALAERLRAQGHKVAPLDFEPGLAPLDRYLDLPPYRVEPHLKLALSGYESTSFGIIVQRAG